MREEEGREEGREEKRRIEEKMVRITVITD